MAFEVSCNSLSQQLFPFKDECTQQIPDIPWLNGKFRLQLGQASGELTGDCHALLSKLPALNKENISMDMASLSQSKTDCVCERTASQTGPLSFMFNFNFHNKKRMDCPNNTRDWINDGLMFCSRGNKRRLEGLIYS